MKIADAKRYIQMGVKMVFAARSTFPVGSWNLEITYGADLKEKTILKTARGTTEKNYSSLESVLNDIKNIDPDSYFQTVSFHRAPVGMRE